MITEVALRCARTFWVRFAVAVEQDTDSTSTANHATVRYVTNVESSFANKNVISRIALESSIEEKIDLSQKNKKHSKVNIFAADF